LAKAITDSPSWIRIPSLIGLTNNRSYPHTISIAPIFTQLPKLWLPLFWPDYYSGCWKFFSWKVWQV